MEIYIGSDHAGFQVKEKLKQFLKKKGFKIIDLGTDSEESIDYPDIAKKVAANVVEDNTKGILICGSGTGMCIAANKIKGTRAVLCYDTYTAKMSRAHNDANILCLRAREFPYERIEEIVAVWLDTDFSREVRHQKRVDKIRRIEQ